MLERALEFLKEKHVCPHCKTEMTLCHAPPVHVGDGLGWGSEFLFVCLNNECPLFVKGWEHIEQQYGHVGSYRYMEIPNSKETYNMMVAGKAAFTGSIVNIEAMKAKNDRFQKDKKYIAALDTCVEEADLDSVLYVLQSEHILKEHRLKAARALVPLNNLDCIDPLRNQQFKDQDVESEVNLALDQILANNFLRECPYCFELIKTRAQVCKHCQKEF